MRTTITSRTAGSWRRWGISGASRMTMTRPSQMARAAVPVTGCPFTRSTGAVLREPTSKPIRKRRISSSATTPPARRPRRAYLFESATKLKVWRMTSRKGQHRLVEPQRQPVHVVDQHGVLIVDGGSDPEALAATKDGRFGPPVTERTSFRPLRIGRCLGDVAHELAMRRRASRQGREHGAQGMVLKFGRRLAAL